jgi:hypothetical protein
MSSVIVPICPWDFTLLGTCSTLVSHFRHDNMLFLQAWDTRLKALIYEISILDDLPYIKLLKI